MDMKAFNEKDSTQNICENDDHERKYRLTSVLSYFVVLIVIGMPVWWYTTRVYRATLPLDKMLSMNVPEKPTKELGIPLSLEYDILISIVNPDPENLHVDLEGEELDVNLQSFLTMISPVADFVVKSQWLYLVELGAVPRKMDNKLVLKETQLPHVITPLESKLWSHLSPRPCLNLVLYIPHCQAPLYIVDKNDIERDVNAFLSPRWGGVYILNANETSCINKYFKPDLNDIVKVFISQLKHMFSLKSDDTRSVTKLKKRKAQDMVDSSRRTLKSLAQLLSEISSIVISDDVAEKINVAVENSDIALEYLSKDEIDQALKHAKIAFENSESAFSDPSLLALLYFPDDQKYAVYIPLFLPVMIPVLMSLTTIKKKYFSKNHVKEKTE